MARWGKGGAGRSGEEGRCTDSLDSSVGKIEYFPSRAQHPWASWCDASTRGMDAWMYWLPLQSYICNNISILKYICYEAYTFMINLPRTKLLSKYLPEKPQPVRPYLLLCKGPRKCIYISYFSTLRTGFNQFQACSGPVLTISQVVLLAGFYGYTRWWRIMNTWRACMQLADNSNWRHVCRRQANSWPVWLTCKACMHAWFLPSTFTHLNPRDSHIFSYYPCIARALVGVELPNAVVVRVEYAW